MRRLYVNHKGFERRVDIHDFVDGSCRPYIESFPTRPGERLANLKARDSRISVSKGRVLCDPR